MGQGSQLQLTKSTAWPMPGNWLQDPGPKIWPGRSPATCWPSVLSPCSFVRQLHEQFTLRISTRLMKLHTPPRLSGSMRKVHFTEPWSPSIAHQLNGPNSMGCHRPRKVPVCVPVSELNITPKGMYVMNILISACYFAILICQSIFLKRMYICSFRK